MTVNQTNNRLFRNERKPFRNKTGAAITAMVAYCTLNGCAVKEPGQALSSFFRSGLSGVSGYPASNSTSVSVREMPSWLDLYREKKLVKVSTVDHVVIVTFETLGDRNEVYGYYSGKFGEEENFASFRDNRDIISFIKDGFGVKITLLDQSKNLWTLEYHKQMI